MREEEASGSLTRRVSRRKLLGTLGRLAGVGLALTVGVTPVAEAAPPPPVIRPHHGDPARSREPETVAASSPNEIRSGGVTVLISADNLPYRYVLADGTEVELDESKLLQAKERALQNKEDEFVSIVPINNISEKTAHTSSPEHPLFDDIPSDALTEAELDQRGINIIQSPHMEFFVLPEAFEEEHPFAGFQPGETHRMKIVFVDGKVIASPFLTDDRYKDVRGYLEDPFTDPDYITNEKSKLEQQLISIRSNQQQSPNPAQLTELRNIKQMLFKIDHMSQDQILKLLAEKHHYFGRGRGLYIPPYHPEIPVPFTAKSREDPNTAVAFFAVGESVQPDQEVQMFFDPEGNFKVVTQDIFRGSSTAPTEKDSFPNPNGYIYDETADELNPLTRPFGAQDSIINIYHEFAHGRLVRDAMIQGKLPDTSEYRADMQALRWIANVWKPWEASGFTDTSKANFGFKLPSGRVIIFRKNTTPLTAA